MENIDNVNNSDQEKIYSLKITPKEVEDICLEIKFYISHLRKAMSETQRSNSYKNFLSDVFDKRIFKQLNIIQYEFMIRDLPAEMRLHRSSYIAGTKESQFPDGPSIMTLQEHTASLLRHIFPGIEESIVNHIKDMIQKRRANFNNMLQLGIDKYNPQAFDDLFETFGEQTERYSHSKIYPNIVIQDGEFTFFMLAWFFHRILLKNTWSEVVKFLQEIAKDTSLPIDLLPISNEKEITLKKLLMECGLGIYNQKDDTVIFSDRWESLLGWIIQVNDKLQVQRDALKIIRTKLNECGFDDGKCEDCEHHLRNLADIIGLKSFPYGSCSGCCSVLQLLLNFFFDRDLINLMRIETEKEKLNSCKISSDILLRILSKIWKNLMAVESLSFKNRELCYPGTGKFEAVLLRLCRAPYLCAEHCVRAFLPISMSLFIRPYGSSEVEWLTHEAPLALGFMTFASGISFSDCLKTNDAMETWIIDTILNSFQGDMIVSLIANMATKAGKLRGIGSILHQLPKDVISLSLKLQEIDLQLEEIRNAHPNISIPKVTRPDSLGIMIMNIQALNEGKLYELPADLAAIVQGTWEHDLLDILVGRVVWPEARTRVYSDGETLALRASGALNFDGYLSSRKIIRQPTLILSGSFAPQRGRGLYPIALITLRSAYQHALAAFIHPKYKIEPFVEIEYQATLPDACEAIIVYNTGKPPMHKKDRTASQSGWIRDLEIYNNRLTSGWQIRKSDEGYYSHYDSQKQRWVTIIERVPDERGI